MQKLVLVAGVLIGLVGAQPAAGQGSVAGTWNAQVDVGVRVEDGVETSVGKRAAIMTLTVKGDSVFGTFMLPADGGAPAQSPTPLRGTRTGAKVALVADPVDRTVNVNGDVQQVKMIVSYALELKGDVLEGTTRVRSGDGAFESSARAFVGRRAAP